MTMTFRAALALLVGLLCASMAWAQEAVPAATQADPAAWGVYAQLPGTEKQSEGGYLMRWRWEEPGVALREEYVVPSTGKLAHYNTIRLGEQPGTLHLKASYLGKKEWNGTIGADGTVSWIGKGFFKLPYTVALEADGTLLYGSPGAASPIRFEPVGGSAMADVAVAAPVAGAGTTNVATAGAAAGGTAAPQSAAEMEALALELQERARALREAEAALAAAQAAANATAGQAAALSGQGVAPAAVQQASAQATAPSPSQVASPVVAAAATPAPAAAVTPASRTDGFTPGTYMLEGGSYVIEVQRDGDGLLVVEPNKRSPYAWHSGRDFHFYNPNTDTTYGIRIIDARTIAAFKPFVDGNVASTLVLIGGAVGTPQEDLGDPSYEAVAEKYAAMIETDPANAQAWSACAASALKYSMATTAEADAYAQQMIGMLRLMDTASTPCEDALPSRLW